MRELARHNCSHLQPLAATCSHLQPLAATCSHLQPLTAIHLAASGRKWPHVAGCGRVHELRSDTCSHLQRGVLLALMPRGVSTTIASVSVLKAPATRVASLVSAGSCLSLKARAVRVALLPHRLPNPGLLCDAEGAACDADDARSVAEPCVQHKNCLSFVESLYRAKGFCRRKGLLIHLPR